MDQQIICDKPQGLFRPCGCGSILFTVSPGVGPHIAQLVCNGLQPRRPMAGKASFQQRAGTVTTNNAEYAEDLAQLGLHIFPCREDKKLVTKTSTTLHKVAISAAP
jgi:hypothetical protein